MELKSFTYLALMLVYLVIPVVLSTQQKVRFIIRLRYLIPAAIFAAAIFAMWTKRFVELDIWSFNLTYLLGFNFLNIPFEEWLSFFIIPLSSAYIYEWLKIKLEQFEKANIFVGLSLVFFVVAAIFSYSFRKNMFTFFTFFLVAIYLGYTIFRNRFKKYYTKFYLTFFIALLPFTIVSTLANTIPLIVYSTDHIIGLAPFGIPIEKVGYLFLLLLINTTIYEYLNERRYF